ncbi:MAG TPA: DUF2007 domain-containing protein [Candidatus Sulfopaludibacter sp.]|nr:DUF2007 domain-containing protein [Candidatus Sulfopaludibacter sp.]
MAQDAGQPGSAEMVTLFSSSAHDAEMEAANVHALLEANEIPSIVVGPSVIPSLEFQVQVEREHLEEARKLIAEAKEAGPEAAAEAEAQTE